MNWTEAVEAMKRGDYVRRKSEMYSVLLQDGDGESMATAPIYERGTEGCFLAHAWTADEQPARIFMGYPSRCLFVPDDEHRAATDWVVVEKRDC